MSDHLVLCVDRLITTDTVQSLQAAETEKPSGEASSSSSSSSPPEAAHGPAASAIEVADDDGDFPEGGEDDPLIQNVECRICQEEDSVKNLETPCACSGSLKYAHRKCVQRWCNEKGDITCEICHQSYQPGYTAPPPAPEDTSIDISEAWTLNGAPLDLRDPRILAMAAAERHFLEGDYDEYADNSASGAAFCRSAALILMALLLLRHALYLNNGDDDNDDASTFFSLFLLRAAGFLLPCYIMAWAISILQRRRQRQEAATLAANEVAFMIQAGSPHGLHIAVQPGHTVAPHHQEPLPTQS